MDYLLPRAGLKFYVMGILDNDGSVRMLVESEMEDAHLITIGAILRNGFGDEAAPA